jgi:hypothetical protein
VNPVNSVDNLIVQHCAHCDPIVWWIENEPGKAPFFGFEGFPTGGHTILTKRTIVVVCRQCSVLDNPFIKSVH